MTYNKEKIKKLIDEFIPSLVVTPDEMDKYLGKMRNLYGYSLYNQIIAMLQYYQQGHNDDPEIFQTFKRWKEIGRYVVKGQKAVYMIRPNFYKKVEVDENGDEKETLKLKSFKPFPVFALPQTKGDALEKNNLIKGESDISFEELINIYKNEFKMIQTQTELTRGSTNGEYIKISNKNSENYRISTLIHEVAHNRLGHLQNNKDTPTAELEAESVAYMVTTMLGLTNEKSRLYICNWNNGDAREAVRKRANTLIKTAEEIYKEINK